MVGVLRKESEQVKFLGCERLFFAVDPYSARSLVDLDAADLHDLIFLYAAPDQSLVSCHMRFYSGDQLAWTEGLGHVVVGAQSQSADLVNVILFGGDHDDRDIFSLPDLLADLETVHTGKHQVEDDQIKFLLQSSCESGVTPVFDLDLKAAQFEIVFFQISDGLFVFNNQYSAHLPVPPDIF